MKYSYFPGCSLEKNSAAYHISTMAVAKPLGLDFEEVEDWNCCGATEYVSLNLTASYALIARNLAQAAKVQDTSQMVAPCSLCYLNLKKCDSYMADSPALSEKVNTALSAGGLNYKPGSLRVRHLLDVIVNDIGYDQISENVSKPLKGLKVAPYYGCLIVRPKLGPYAAFDDTENPETLDKLLRALGAEVVDFPMKAQCCGGHMTQISESTGFELIRRIVKGAADNKADIIATLCPMCQLNLDAFQGPMNNYFSSNYQIPVLFFTQLIGLAYGLKPEKLGIGLELVNSRSALAKIGVELPEAEVKKPAKEALPMPSMPEEK